MTGMADHTCDPHAPNTCTFVSACLAGSASGADIDDWVDAWHDSESERTLAQFLGLTDEEYSRWVADPRTLNGVLATHRAAARACPPPRLLPRTPVPTKAQPAVRPASAAPTVTGHASRPCGCPDDECHDAGKTGCYFGSHPGATTSEGPPR